MNCDEAHIKLSMLLDNQFDSAELDEVNEHLASCADCRELYEKMKKLDALTDDIEPTPGDDFFDAQKKSIMDKISKEQNSNVVTVDFEKKTKSYSWYKYTAIAATIALLTLFSVNEYFDFEDNTPRRKPEAQKGVQKLTDDANSEHIMGGGTNEQIVPREIDDELSADNSPVEVSTQAYPAKSNGASMKSLSKDSKTIVLDNDKIEDAKIESAETVKRGSGAVEKRVMSNVHLDEATDADIGQIKESRLEDKTTAKFRADAIIEEPEIELESMPVTEKKKTLIEPLSVEAGYIDQFDVESSWMLDSYEEADPLAFAEFNDEDKETYQILKQKVENLNNVYGYLLVDEQRNLEKSAPQDFSNFDQMQLSDDSLGLISKEMAEAYHDLGMITPVESERKSLLSWLKKILKFVDDNSVGLVKRFISDLEDKTPETEE